MSSDALAKPFSRRLTKPGMYKAKLSANSHTRAKDNVSRPSTNTTPSACRNDHNEFRVSKTPTAYTARSVCFVINHRIVLTIMYRTT